MARDCHDEICVITRLIWKQYRLPWKRVEEVETIPMTVLSCQGGAEDLGEGERIVWTFQEGKREGGDRGKDGGAGGGNKRYRREQDYRNDDGFVVV